MARSGRGLAMNRTLNSPAQFAEGLNRLAHHVRIRIVPERADLIDGSRITDVADDSRYSCAHLRIAALQVSVKLVQFPVVFTQLVHVDLGLVRLPATQPTREVVHVIG